MPHKITLKEIAIVVVLFALTNLVSAYRQKPMTFNGGLCWEWDYYLVAEDFKYHVPVEAQAPFVYRLGTPFLVSLISPDDLVHGFKVLNITASFVACLLLLFWLGGYVSNWKVRILLLTLFLIQWDAPSRAVYSRPVHVDTMYFVLVLLGLMVIRRYQQHPSLKWLGCLIALTFVGTFFREILLTLGVCFLAVHQPVSLSGPPGERWPRMRLPPLRHWLPFLAGACGIFIIHHLARATNVYHLPHWAVYYLFAKPAIGYLLAWFLAFGPVLFIVIYDWRNVWAFLAERQHFLLFLATIAFLGYCGGSDTERFLYWSMPCTYILLGRAMERLHPVLTRWPVALTFILGQAMTSRVLWTIPDFPTSYPHTFPILQEFGSNVQFVNLFSWDDSHHHELLAIAQFVIYGTVILCMIRWLEQRNRSLEHYHSEGLK